MSKLIILLLVALLLVSCSSSLNNMPLRTEGVIEKIEKYRDSTVVVTVLFYYPESTVYSTIRFVMPDTVRVGQHFKLKPL
jgi:hypothetical protein